MILGLATYKFINKDIEFNISQIEKAIKSSENIDMLCFGEAFLQGFDAFNWNYDNDKNIAISKDSNTMKRLEQLYKKERRNTIINCHQIYMNFLRLLETN